MDARGIPGGILWLFDLIERARPELSYDLRHFLQISINDLGHSVPYREAIDLIAMMRRNPTSFVHASEEGWSFPVSFEWIVLKHLFDLTAKVNSESEPPGYPAPWDNADKPKPMSREAVEAALRKMNPERQTNG